MPKTLHQRTTLYPQIKPSSGSSKQSMTYALNTGARKYPPRLLISWLMLELAVWYFLGTLLTIIPVHVGVNIAPVNSSIHNKGMRRKRVLTNPMGKAKINAKNPKYAHNLIAFSRFSPLYPPFRSEK